jgi:N-[(2S)-2-amino-2-carboxyethyl]-L-glutamate dehydrogenase
MRVDTLLYLSGSDVAAALDHVDVVGAVAAALAAHGRGETILSAEAYLGWEHNGEPLRSLAMPAEVDSAPGVKIISATVELLAVAPVERLALIGAGALARCHLELLPPRLPQLREIRVYDRERKRAESLGASVSVSDSAEQAIRGAGLIVTVTTTTTPYLRHEWLQPGALLVNVSLDDPLPEVFLRADKLFVDDWNLIAADEHRLLGRLLRGGTIARADDTELGRLLAGAQHGRSHPDEIVVVNPFGLAIEDLAVAKQVYAFATASGLGTNFDR